MRMGLDLDGLLDERPDFFAFLTAALRSGGHFVAILTYRDPASREKTEAQLRGWGIVFDELHFARSLSDKGRLCRELDIDVYFDDQTSVWSASKRKRRCSRSATAATSTSTGGSG